MKWPWQRRFEEAHAEFEEAARERLAATKPLTDRALHVIGESVRHREENHFRQAIESLMQQQKGRHP